MDVVVSGSSGFIGQALLPALDAAGHRAVPLLRGVDRPGALRWDPDAGTIDAAGLEGVGALVHLAGESIGARRWTDDQKRRIRESRTRGTGLLARTLAGLARPPGVLVSASAIGIYGDRGPEICTERSVRGTGFLADVVELWEAAAAPAVDAGIRTVFLRSGIVLDPEGGVLRRMVRPFRLGLGGRLGTGTQYTSWITRADEVRVILTTLDDAELAGPVNASAPNPVTNAELTRTLGHVLHRPTVLPTPLLPLRMRYGRELVQALLLDGQRVVPQVLLDRGFHFEHPELDGALRALLRR